MSEKNLTIIVIANNECEHAKLSIESIRNFCDVENVNVILADNASTDGLREWASTQTDITYIFMDDEEVRYGDLLSQIVTGLDIHDDLLVMEAHYMITPYAISRMYDSLYSSDNIGLVSCISNSWQSHQALPGNITNYQEAANFALNSVADDDVRTLATVSGLFMIKNTALSDIGGFNPAIGSSYYLSKNLALQLLEKKYEIMISTSSVVWDLQADSYISKHSIKYFTADEHATEQIWGMHYFNFQPNPHLICEIECPKDKEINVLEIGCDCGATLFEIKNLFPNSHIYGCELNPVAVNVASHFMEAKVCNIEDEKIPFDVDGFDYVIFGDVLEHLHNPQKTIRFIRSILKPDGKIIASIPNFMHVSVMEDLLKGNFTYTETGLLDKTHIHMFTYNEIVRMFNSENYRLENISSIKVPISESQLELIPKLLALDSSAERFMYETFQYTLRAKRINQ